jgi:hypothetical protein
MPVEKPCHVNQIRSMLSCLRWPRRRTIIGFAFLGLVCIGALVYFMNRVEYRLLYRDLNPADMQVIAAEFREQKKNFIVQGTSILVEASRTEIQALRGEIPFRLARRRIIAHGKCSLSGRVTFAATGEPASSIKVNAQESDRSPISISTYDATFTSIDFGMGGGNAITDNDGNFTIGQLTPGNYNVNVLLTGQMDRDWTSVAYDSTPLKEDEKRAGLDIKLIKGGLIQGTVRSSDGKPVEGIHVGVYGPARPRSGAWVQGSMTDKYGKYTFRVPTGKQWVYLMGYPTDRPAVHEHRVTGQDISVEDGKETKVDFTFSQNNELGFVERTLGLFRNIDANSKAKSISNRQ